MTPAQIEEAKDLVCGAWTAVDQEFGSDDNSDAELLRIMDVLDWALAQPGVQS